MQKVTVKSFGCSANFAEGEIIKGKFSEKGKIVDSDSEADTIILNICTVKGDKKALDEIKSVQEANPGKKIAIAGCITPSIVEPIKQISSDITLVNTHNILEMPTKVSTGEDSLGRGKPVKLLQPRVRTNPVVGIVPISSGCLDACAYCSTRLVKGVLFSFPPDVIEDEVKKCVSDGCREIWITGQDTCCYGFDRKTNLAELLQRLVNIPGDFKIRVGMGNPRHVPKYQNELIKVMKHDKIFKFVHLPLQAGNDDVLRAMRRGHNVAQFKDLMLAIRQAIPEMTFSTDIIVGHPGESEEQFHDTLKLCQELEFDVVNIARFSPRPGTPSATMPEQVHGNVKKERSRQLSYICKHISQKRNDAWVGWEGEIIVDNKVKGGVSGRNYAYKPIFLAEDLKLGDVVKVKVVKAEHKFLKGERA